MDLNFTPGCKPKRVSWLSDFGKNDLNFQNTDSVLKQALRIRKSPMVNEAILN